MADDRAIIKALSKQTGEKIKEMPLGSIMFFGSNGYARAADGRVMGLNLEGAGITGLSLIGGLTGLTLLQLGYNKISDISPLAGLTSLTELSLGDNQLTDLSPLAGLTALKILRLENNQLTDISPLAGLTALTLLSLDRNQLTDVSPLAGLTGLTFLNLSGIRLTDLSPLAGLTALTELYLYSNQLTDLSPLAGLTALTSLELSGNQLTGVSPLAGLTHLTTLWLNINQLTDLSPLAGLTALTELYLSDNQLTGVSPLAKLTGLTNLSLSENKLTDLSPLAGLTALTKLWLHNNQLTDLSPLYGLKELKYLDLRHNAITRLPENMVVSGRPIQWEWKLGEPGLFLAGNPLETPPIEVVQQGHEAVVNYFQELKKASVRLLQSKLLLVGNGEVGKTTLMKKLIDNDFQVIPGTEASTHGIHIAPWKLEVPFKDTDAAETSETVTLHFWDFGGQDIYHATHQFFLTKRSLYLFVWEVRREEETRSFDYWLNIVKLLSAESPVIVVMNKADLRTKYIDEAGFKKKFPNIQAFCKVSCLDNRGIGELTGLIRDRLALMPHLRDKLPRAWVDIRQRLEKERKKKNYIGREEYLAICREYGLERERAEFLSGYLHDLGVILHYRHDPLLENTVILNPEWATEAVYALIDRREIQDNRGSFKFDDLKKYWDKQKYPPEKHAQLVRLMETFELCFNFAGTALHFVPELLPPRGDSPDISAYQEPGTLRFQYHYDFMPEGIVSRFMARVFYLIHEKKHFWKNGVELQFENSLALVQGEQLNRRLTIAVTGACQRELLAIIRSHFDYIHASLNMEKDRHFHEMVPCTCTGCAGSANPYLFAYHTLRKFIDKGETVISCQESVEKVDIYNLVKGFEPTRPSKDLLTAVLAAAFHLQGLALDMSTREDARTSLIVTLLKVQGFMAGDQGRWGQSATGKSAGRPDAMIASDQGLEAIVEAFNLGYLDTAAIDKHCIKIFGYDPHGLERNFMVIYADSQDFPGLWEKYKAHLKDISFPYPLSPGKGIEEKPVRFAGMRVALARHERTGRQIGIYHVFVNMRAR